MQGQYFPDREVFQVQIGKEYVVFGVYFVGEVPWVLLASSWYVVPVPLWLFEITDPRVSVK